MVAAWIRVAPLMATGAVEPHELLALLWEATTDDEGMEHIRVRAGPEYLDVLAFVRGTDNHSAHRVLERLVRRVIDRNPRMRLMRII
jgi:hypothetical protein